MDSSTAQTDAVSSASNTPSRRPRCRREPLPPGAAWAPHLASEVGDDRPILQEHRQRHRRLPVVARAPSSARATGESASPRPRRRSPSGSAPDRGRPSSRARAPRPRRRCGWPPAGWRRTSSSTRRRRDRRSSAPARIPPAPGRPPAVALRTAGIHDHVAGPRLRAGSADRAIQQRRPRRRQPAPRLLLHGDRQRAGFDDVRRRLRRARQLLRHLQQRRPRTAASMITTSAALPTSSTLRAAAPPARARARRFAATTS